MSVKETDVIDSIGIEEGTNTLVLLIADPYPWTIQEIDHMKTYQKKINNYVHYIETGGYRSRYGSREFDGFRIKVVMKHKWSLQAENFFAAGKKQLIERNIAFEYSLFAPKEDRS